MLAAVLLNLGCKLVFAQEMLHFVCHVKLSFTLRGLWAGASLLFIASWDKADPCLTLSLLTKSSNNTQTHCLDPPEPQWVNRWLHATVPWARKRWKSPKWKPIETPRGSRSVLSLHYNSSVTQLAYLEKCQQMALLVPQVHTTSSHLSGMGAKMVLIESV